MLLRVRWQLIDDDRGTAWVMEGLEDLKWVFESLDQLPEWIAEIIRKDGRPDGEFITTEGNG